MPSSSSRLKHLHENRRLTFDRLSTALRNAASGRLENASEDLSALSLIFTWDDESRKPIFARSISEARRGGSELPVFTESTSSLGASIPAVGRILSGAVASISSSSRRAIFEQAAVWYPIEVRFSGTRGLVNYDAPIVAFDPQAVALKPASMSIVESHGARRASPVLAARIETMQSAVTSRQRQARSPIVARMNRLARREFLSPIEECIDEAIRRTGLTEAATVEEYVRRRLADDAASAGLPHFISKDVVQLTVSSPATAQKIFNKSDHGNIKRFIKASPHLIEGYLAPIESAIGKFVVEQLCGLGSTLTADDSPASARLRNDIRLAVEAIRSAGPSSVVSAIVEGLRTVGAHETSGLGDFAFLWKGKSYRFTGSFSAVTSLLEVLRIAERPSDDEANFYG